MAMQGPPPRNTPPPTPPAIVRPVSDAVNDWASYQIDNDTQRERQRRELEQATRRNNQPTSGQH